MEDGSDNKSLYHTLRLLSEGVELLTTGHITYPRPEANILMKIRLGKISQSRVYDLIEETQETLLHLYQDPIYDFVPVSRQQSLCEILGKQIQRSNIEIEVCHGR